MADQTAHDIASRRVLYTLPGMESVTIRRDVEYRRGDDGPLTMDLYSPVQSDDRALLPALNDALDRFIAAALARNLPITVVNHAAAPHAFDLFDDSDATREVVRQILAFL